MTRPHARAGQPYEYPAEPSGEQIAKELHARYFGEPQDLEQISNDILVITAWTFLVILALFLICVFAVYWSAS